MNDRKYWILVVLLCLNLIGILLIILWIYWLQFELDLILEHLKKFTEWIVKADTNITISASNLKEFALQLSELIKILKKIL